MAHLTPKFANTPPILCFTPSEICYNGNKHKPVPKKLCVKIKNMKTIFDHSTREGLASRTRSLNESSLPQWGKMNVYQMLKHCTAWDEWVLGKNDPVYKRVFIGYLFGRAALKSIMKDDGPLRRNTPTIPALIIKEKSGDMVSAQSYWIQLLGEYDQFSNVPFVHDFFGKMTREQVGILAFKHADHHLRQFNC